MIRSAYKLPEVHMLHGPDPKSPPRLAPGTLEALEARMWQALEELSESVAKWNIH